MSDEAVVATGAVVGEQSAPEAVEAPKAQETPEAAKPQDDKFASKFAALSRKEKAVREQERQVQLQAQRIKAMETELNKYKSEYEQKQTEWEKLVKEKPLEAISKYGWDYDKLSEMVLNDNNPTPQQLIARTRAELEQAYKSDLEQLKASMREKEEAEARQIEEQAVNAFKDQLRSFVDSNEKYELTKMNEAYDLVYDVVQEYYEKTKKVLSHEEAADYVEQYLEEKANQVLQAKKMQQKLAPKAPPAPGKPTNSASPTLSNTLSAEKPVNGTRNLSKEESLREAAKLIRWDE